MKNFNNLSNLSQRVITAIFGALLILAGILYNEWTFWLLFLLISVLTQVEFYKLTKLDQNLPLSIYGTICGIVLNSITFFIEKDYLPFKYYYVIVPLLTLTFFIKLYKKDDPKPFTNLGLTFLGLIYVAVPFSLINELIIDGNTYKPYSMIGILLILWGSDSGAYFAGTYFGKKKLFERISPKKTWEGFLGGFLTAILIATIYAQYCRDFSQTQWIFIAIIIVITGTLGDLVESLFKRSLAIKDSGSLIPGHGGFLDRFDGLLLSLPFIITYVKLFGA